MSDRILSEVVRRNSARRCRTAPAALHNKIQPPLSSQPMEHPMLAGRPAACVIAMERKTAKAVERAGEADHEEGEERVRHWREDLGAGSSTSGVTEYEEV
jgi:hypothetical protein